MEDPRSHRCLCHSHSANSRFQSQDKKYITNNTHTHRVKCVKIFEVINIKITYFTDEQWF